MEIERRERQGSEISCHYVRSLPIASATGLRKRRVNFGCRRLESDADVAPRFLASSSMKLLTRLLEKEERDPSFLF